MKTAEPKSAPSQQSKTAANSWFDRGQESNFFAEPTVDRSAFFPATAPNLIQTQPIAGHQPFFAHSPAPTVQAKCATCKDLDKSESETLPPETPQIQMMPAFESAADGDEPPAEQPFVQFSLNIGQPGDAYEREADAMASQVMNMPVPTSQPTVQRQAAGEDNEIQPKSLAKDITALVQRKEHSASSNASPNLESQLNSSKGGGNPLSNEVRSFMEPRFGTDFSQVRVHTDSAAVQMNQDLQSQAFTHGSDVYFGAGKSPGKNDLTAHELTHTVQQGSSKGSGQPNAAIQKAQGDPPKTFRKINEGIMQKDGGKYAIILTNFPVKKYAYLPFSKPYLKVPQTERKTKQVKIWKEKMAQPIKDSLANVIPDDLKQEPSLTLKLKHSSSNEKKQTAVVGNFDTLAKAILVPFWDKGGHPMIHQIEHKIDWQIMGDGADDIGNFLLIDAETNSRLGRSVQKDIRNAVKKTIDHYRNSGFEDVTNNVDEAFSKYNILFEVSTFKFQEVSGFKSIIASTQLQPSGGVNPIRRDNITVHKTEIPENHLILKTSKKGEGYIIPYDFKNDFIQLEVEKDSNGEKKLNAVILKDIAKDSKGNLDLDKPDKPLSVTKESAHVYKAKTEGYAGVLKNIIRLRQLSPIEWDEVDFDFKNGWSGGGKIITDVELLKDVDISFGLQNSIFTVEATVTSTALKDKLPKPFQIDFCSFTIAANSLTGLSFVGSLGFSIDKLGQGILSAGIDRKGIFVDGDFNFDSKYFNPAQISVAYKNGEWSIGGKIGIQKGLIPGIKDATLAANYAKDTFSIAGLAHLSVPGIDAINLAAQFDDKGNFAFTADVNLKEMKGIKSGNVKVTISSKAGEEDIKLRVEGKAAADFPNVPNLNTELSVLYDNGIFKVETTVNYQKGRFNGTISVGVTNQIVDDKGNPQGEPNQTGEVFVFGFGQLTVDIFKGNTGTVFVRLTPDKEVLIAGQIVLQNLSAFGDGVNYDKEILPFPQLEIPLVGIPGLSVSAFITGGVHFKFNWQPLMLKLLKVEFKETKIDELENAQLDITGSVGSIATAEVYMSINAGLKARALIATLSGSLGGEAGLGVTAEAGGDLQATWNMEKGLQLKEIMAHLDVTPRAVFRLTGDVSVDLDLWVTSVNLYYHKWIFAEKELDMSGLTLKANFPILFDERGDLIEPAYDKMSLEKPNFTGEQGKGVLDKAINGDAEKELAAKKEEIRATIKNDLRNSSDKDFTPTKYTQKMKKKYSKSPELQEFVVAAIEDESRLIEYEQFEKYKNTIKQYNLPLANKLYLVEMFDSFNSYVTSTDIEAFKAELIKIEEDEKTKAERDKQIAEQAKQEQLAQENAQKPKASKQKSKTKKTSTPKARAKASS